MNEALTETELRISAATVSPLIFGAARGSAELAVRQYLLTRVAGMSLNRALLGALGRPGSTVVHPLPPEWRVAVERNGFDLAAIRAAAVWGGYVVLHLAVGVLSLARRAGQSLVAVIRRSGRMPGGFVYFDGLNRGNLPSHPTGGRGHDVVSWYHRWEGGVRPLEAICHGVPGVGSLSVGGVPVLAVSSANPPLTAVRPLLRFCVWSVAATVLATVDLLRGRWWHALMLREASGAAMMRLRSPSELAREYLFHNSNWIYRPLWTYEAEARGSRITFYFYSANTEGFRWPDGYPPIPYGWRAMSWPRLLVWDEYHADFVRRAVGDRADVVIVGPICFQSSPDAVPPTATGGIAAFDVAPFRACYYQLLGLDSEYYVPSTAIGFLSGVTCAARQAGLPVVWKRKRHFSSRTHPRYRAFASSLAARDGIVMANPDISAFAIIEAASMVVSMPFTSTALIGRAAGKPSCYYDSTGLLDKGDRGAHGIPILSTPDELAEWISARTRDAEA